MTLRFSRSEFPLPVIGFVGSSGSGKTTLIARLVPELTARGVRAAVLKHARHGFDLDRPGKDSYRAREAGAVQVMVASASRWVLMTELAQPRAEPPFGELLDHFDSSIVDLVLAEGFATERYPKIEVFRPSHGQPPKCWPHDPDIIAVASDTPLAIPAPMRWFDLNQPAPLADALAALLLDLRRPVSHAV